MTANVSETYTPPRPKSLVLNDLSTRAYGNPTGFYANSVKLVECRVQGCPHYRGGEGITWIDRERGIWKDREGETRRDRGSWRYPGEPIEIQLGWDSRQDDLVDACERCLFNRKGDELTWLFWAGYDLGRMVGSQEVIGSWDAYEKRTGGSSPPRKEGALKHAIRRIMETLHNPDDVMEILENATDDDSQWEDSREFMTSDDRTATACDLVDQLRANKADPIKLYDFRFVRVEGRETYRKREAKWSNKLEDLEEEEYKKSKLKDGEYLYAYSGTGVRRWWCAKTVENYIRQVKKEVR